MLSRPVLKAYLNRLTNLSSRNRSLLLSNLPAEQFLDLHETDFLQNKPSFDIIRQLIARRPAIPVCDVLDSRREKSNEISRKLRKISRTERFIAEERGAQDVYVGYPFVRGKLADGTVIHGPLVFFPVRLEQQGNQWLLIRRTDEPITLNRSFLLAYAFYNAIRLPDELLDQSLDDFDRDATVFRTQLYELLKASSLEINFNSDLFTDALQWFDGVKKTDLTTLERTGELKLFPEAVLGVFPQAGSYLAPDYELLLAEGENTPISEDDWLPSALPVSHPTIREEHLHTPLLLDASQEAAIRRVKAGESLVVQGPPGTGKSQLIGNLMADFAAGGKRVLLVCQKRAALDVVYERLRAIGMQPFSALIHDFKNDRKALYDQIAGQIEQVDAYRQQNYGLDAILLERTFDAESRRIDQTLAELQAFKDALFDESEAGLSVKQLYLTSDPTAPLILLEDLYTQFRLDAVGEFVVKLRRYSAYQVRLGESHPWRERRSFAAFSFGQLPQLRQFLHQLPLFVQSKLEQSRSFTDRTFSLTDWRNISENKEAITGLLDFLESPELGVSQPAEQRWQWLLRLQQQPNHPLHSTEPSELERLQTEVLDCLSGVGIEPTLPVTDLPNMAQRLEEAIARRESLVGRTVWNWFSKDKAELQALATANGLTLTDEDLPLLREKIQRRIRFEVIRQQAEQRLHQSLTPQSTVPTLRLAQQALGAFRRIQALGLTSLPASTGATYAPFAEAIRQLLYWSDEVADQLKAWTQWLSAAQIESLWREPTGSQALSQSLEQDVDLLIEVDQLRESFTQPEREVIARLGHSADADRFLNSLRLTWIDHIETRHPILRGTSSLRISQLEATLQESIRQKQALSQQILLVKLREQTYQNLTFNRLNNRVTYRELAHQVTKKRAIWPVRKLMETYADEVFQLVPCWMASPESVSAIFPMIRNLFDLVIFDEASQCFAESGIPAMYRARQVVITGDSKQLQPTDLYRIRFEPDNAADEAGTEVELEVESLLDLATHYFPQTQLRGHYRSRSLDLIDFSNRQFYKNSLHLLPDFHQLNQHQPAIHYRNVRGTWQNNTNEAEARAVVALIEQLGTEAPSQSIGVVTFNFPQQQLIQELLETSSGTPSVNPSGESLFVKNIENVQGDERDIIIFSVGYAPDSRGRLAAQFGSLNAKGGENRLNVAVTRARERIDVITSLEPQQLAVEHTANEGPKLLKQYLEYAQSVANGSYRPQTQPTQPIPGGQLLKDQLKDGAEELVEELPFADLTRKQNEHYTGLLLTDDGIYYESTVKDAHAYTPLGLQRKNWPFQRVYSRDYWRNMALF